MITDDSSVDSIVKALNAKKAENIKVLYVSPLTTFTDYFIIATGKSTTHVQALSDFVEETMQKENKQLIDKEGYNTAEWILLGYDDAIVHIFHGDTREFYGLERIWKDAPEINIDGLLD